ncbi:MAG TPA: efflux RND transporter periplasmic adaptor subunit [Thiohalobacter sp.]|nr:efflux RND transporter periplasmic adaptor subunit [Thiohalobacter sp.]
MSFKRRIVLILILLAAAWLAWALAQRLLQDGETTVGGRGERGPVPVEVAAIEQGPIALRRSFTGSLDANADFMVAPKIEGRIEAISVYLGDRVSRGEVVARLDAAEQRQAVAQAEAELAVARANQAEARSQLALAERELKRLEQLRQRGIGSESELDVARAGREARQAQVEVARAQISRAEAALAMARIRLGYTRVTADWSGGSETREVAERFLDEGETVAANAPLLRIVELDPLIAVFHVPERDYARLQRGQRADLYTDAYPGEVFGGEIARIAPVFRANARQARVELRIDNPGHRLKPGMFARIDLVLERVEKAVIVPEAALVRRDGGDGVFRVTADGQAVAWVPVQPDIREAGRVQVEGLIANGSVVVLGQQLLKDGASIRVADDAGLDTP